MIRLRDSFTLALTKLRTRKVRLGVTVIVSGLLFCALMAASLVVRGVFHSLDSFNDEGFGKRFIVSGYTQGNFNLMQDPKVIVRAEEIHKDLIARKKAAAKTLGIEYDATSEPSPIQEFDTPGGKQKNLDTNNPSAKQAIKELTTSGSTTIETMKKSAKPYNAINAFQSRVLSQASDGSTLQVIKNGEETFTGPSQQNGPPSGTDSFTSFWTLMSGELMEPFLLEGVTLTDKGDGTIPIVVPISAAEQLLKLKALPASAKPVDRLERMKELRTKAALLSFQVCYRNSTSTALISSALSTAQEIEQNKKNKDYVKPELINGLPAKPCGPSTVTRDVRDADEKKLSAKQEQFDLLFGKQAASQESLNFRVVGLSPDFANGAAFGISEIIRSLVTSSLGNGWFTPQEYEVKNPLLAKVFTTDATTFSQPPTYFAEFPTAGDARRFIDTESCQPDFAFSVQTGPGSDPFEKCNKNGKYFTLEPYGSNSLALDSAKKGFGKVFGIAALVAAVIAAIIMMGTVGRMIADSRRETAVFRAIGAKKLDIAQVYILYTILLALLICLFAIAVGMILAVVANNKYGPQATVEALVSYNAQDLSRKFVLFYPYPSDVLRLTGLIVSASIVSSFLPLLRNLRRNPIRDMRDDT